MKICFRMQVVLSLSLLFLPLTLTAQKFQEPTRDELQMTSDAKFPGVSAIFLYRESSTDNFNHFVSEYARIKVLTELGKEWATVEVPYSGSGAPPRIEGRTIHADGTVIPLIGKAEDLLVMKNTERHWNARVFTLPSVEVGSILEYRWTLPNSEGNVGPDRAALVIKTQPGSGVIDIKHIFARAFVLLDPKEYPTLRDYYQKMAATNQQQVILLPGTAATGN